jgi:CubicO group peptidase (beta-lactamase class C family)
MKPILFLLAALTLAAQTPIQNAMAYMAATAKDNAFMGTVLVAKDGKVLFSNGYGFANLEHNVPNTPDTKFRLGSLTKQFTAVAILQLEEQGKLKVTDPACNYLPNCPATWRPITIHHLATHTSGLFNFTEDPDHDRTTVLPSPPAKSLEKIRDKPLRFDPGTKFEYSNSGYVALALVIEKASGETYAGYMQKHIFTPAGMQNSGHDDHTPILPNRATGYQGAGKSLRHAPYHDMTIPIGAGDLYSTVQDLLLWDQALRTDVLLKSRAKLFTPEKENYAYGWEVTRLFNRPIHTHDGGINGFSTIILRFPGDNLVSIVLSNNASPVTGKIGRGLAAIFLGEKFDIPKIRSAITLPAESLDRYLGKFALAPTAIMSITREGSQLFTQLTGQGKIEIYPESPDTFFPKVVDASITFRFGPDGKATGLTLNQNGRKMPAERVP